MATLAMVLLGYLLLLGDQRARLDVAVRQEATLKQQFVAKKRQAVTRTALERQVGVLRTSLSPLLNQLSARTEMEALLAEIQQAGARRGLQFELFRPGGELKSAELAERSIDLRLTGSYDELLAFVDDIGQLSRIVTLGSLVLTPANGQDGRLTLQAVAHTYRTLEPEERSTQTSGGGQSR
ncbi:type 4a pilus biogenesis protein PilO [Crenobacter sp. SG2303]|uniref:Type 4a pilus biogenesis protein PilO n=1 Tax=Crenobacter oryzisoli TaxID=3056844 RepID=A0ABT7XM99_9NEIS|nr:type 4a pilus biogenesis protein PilO [Crenobacter sp. SG2303]MDN0074813.1 type 4a pilus biogenesis protein PilO [Crenobacter sp. SG2303]